MKRLANVINNRWCWLILAGPPLAWFLLITLLPTGWLRRRIETRLERATGQIVRLERVRVGYLGGISLHQLTAAAQDAPKDPFANIETIELDVSLAQLLGGRARPDVVTASGIDLTIRRDSSGRIELNSLLNAFANPDRGADSENAGPASAAAPGEFAQPIFLVLRQLNVRIDDEITNTRLEFENGEGSARLDEKEILLEHLAGTINSGQVELAARVDRSQAPARFEADCRAAGVELDQGMKWLGYLVPLVATKHAELQGRLELALKLRGPVRETHELLRAIEGNGSIAIDPVTLDGSILLSELGSMLPASAKSRIGSIRGSFVIARQRVLTKDTVFKIGDVPLELSGWNDFDGKLRYTVRSEKLESKLQALSGRLPDEAKQLLRELPVEIKNLTAIQIRGTVGDPIVLAQGMPIRGGSNNGAAAGSDDMKRLREIGQRLKERLLR